MCQLIRAKPFSIVANRPPKPTSPSFQRHFIPDTHGWKVDAFDPTGNESNHRVVGRSTKANDHIFGSFSKCSKVRQEMCEFNTKITIVQLLRLTIFSAKSKIHSPRRGYLSPGNSIVLEIEAALLFISVTIFADFGAHLLKFKHASNNPVYKRDLCTRCGPIFHHGL